MKDRGSPPEAGPTALAAMGGHRLDNRAVAGLPESAVFRNMSSDLDIVGDASPVSDKKTPGRI
jgi:hypothetical protein